MWVARAEPGGHGAWVRAADNHNFNIVLVDLADKVCQIGESLLRTKVAQACKRPVFHGLRLAVEAVLKH